MSVLDEAEKYQKEYIENIFKNVNNLCEKAWELGLDITEIRIQDSWVQDIGPFFYGDKITLKAPDIKEINTDFGTVRIIK